jgi:hypothetical protein
MWTINGVLGCFIELSPVATFTWCLFLRQIMAHTFAADSGSFSLPQAFCLVVNKVLVVKAS